MRGFALGAMLMLAGCDDITKDQVARDIARDAQIKGLSALDQIDALKREIASMKEEQARTNEFVASTYNYTKAVDDARERLRKTFNHNVDLDNKAKAAAMTARGACGTEMRQLAAGGWVYANKECTVDDLR